MIYEKKQHYLCTNNDFLNSHGPSLLEVKIEKGSLKNLIRINNLSEIKENFMNELYATK